MWQSGQLLTFNTVNEFATHLRTATEPAEMLRYQEQCTWHQQPGVDTQVLSYCVGIWLGL